MEIQINLNNTNDVKNFVAIMQSIPEETILKSGKYVVDAKSIMGVLSLDLSKPITLELELAPAVTLRDMQEMSKKISQFEYVD